MSLIFGELCCSGDYIHGWTDDFEVSQATEYPDSLHI